MIFFRSVGRILSLLRTLWTRTDRATASVTTSRPCSQSVSAPVSSPICCLWEEEMPQLMTYLAKVLTFATLGKMLANQFFL